MAGTETEQHVSTASHFTAISLSINEYSYIHSTITGIK